MIHLVALLLAAGFGVGGVGAAPAVPRPYVSAEGGTVAIGGRPALRLTTPAAGMTPDQRAALVAQRLEEGRTRKADPNTIALMRQDPDACILWGDAPILTVTTRDASAARSTAEGLARSWVHRLRGLLGTPPLTVSRSQVIVPLGETREVTFGGILGAARGSEGGGGVVSVTLSRDGRRAVLRALKSGDTSVTFTADGVSLPVEVAVRPYAARIWGPPDAHVTGYLTPRDLVERMAMQTVRHSLILQPDAVAQVGTPRGTMALRAGHTIRLAVPVRVEAPGCLPVGSDIRVVVRNDRLPRAAAPRLYYSNDPERVQGYGSLFLSRLNTTQPARLLYHHQNALGRRFALIVDLVNPGPDEVRVHITEGAAEHGGDPIVAGHRAARSFVDHQRGGIGYITTIAPGSRTTVAWHALRPGAVASGVFALRQLSGRQGCYIQVKADDTAAPFVQPPDDRYSLSPTVFASAVKQVKADYRVGGQWAFIRVGSQVTAAGGRLSEEGFGDYGVTYDITLTLSNPTDVAQKVGLVFEAASGKARGLFLVDGQVVETETLSAHDELVLAVYSLPPGGMRSVRVSTIPLSGSSYPARLVARELPAHPVFRPGSLLKLH